jgi:hypothetical protein
MTLLLGQAQRYTLAALVILACLSSARVAHGARGLAAAAHAQGDNELDLTHGNPPAQEPKGGYFAAATGGVCLDSWAGAPIKAGTTASGKHVYYLPEDAGYDDVTPALCFQIEEGATYAGFERVQVAE